MVNKSYLEVLNWASSFLENHGQEIYIAEYLLLERLGWSKTEWLMNMKKPVPTVVLEQLEKDLKLVLEDYPPQYIIGSCEFYGECFKVTPATLIPRPETEELVELCLTTNDQSQPLKVLDIGTGTGAIALSLKRHAPVWQVTAVDLSSEALEVARQNAENQKLDIAFLLGDLTEPVKAEEFDIVISNPPYIGNQEWAEMDTSVRTYEPKLALFADNQGLAIYERLALELPAVIKSTGKIYLEIGYRQGEAVKELFKKEFPTKIVSIHQDLAGQERMVSVCG